MYQCSTHATLNHHLLRGFGVVRDDPLIKYEE